MPAPHAIPMICTGESWARAQCSVCPPEHQGALRECGAIPQHSSRVSKFGREFLLQLLAPPAAELFWLWETEVGSVSEDFTVPLTQGSLVGEEGEEKGECKGNTT